MQTIILIFLGSGIGGVLRYSMALLMQNYVFPNYYATFLCNFIGSLTIGIIANLLLPIDHNKSLTAFLMIGLLGGFTTFSSFSLEAIKLLEVQFYQGIIYIILTIFVTLASCGLGFWLSRLFLKV